MDHLTISMEMYECMKYMGKTPRQGEPNCTGAMEAFIVHVAILETVQGWHEVHKLPRYMGSIGIVIM